jgi:hypothetical protein
VDGSDVSFPTATKRSEKYFQKWSSIFYGQRLFREISPAKRNKKTTNKIHTLQFTALEKKIAMPNELLNTLK